MIPEFLFCTNKQALPGVGLVLQTTAPFYVGQIIQFETRSRLDDFVAKRQANDGFFIGGKPHGYNILVVFAGVLAGKVELNTQTQADALAAVYRKMSDFYLTEKIQNNPNAYKKYKER